MKTKKQGTPAAVAARMRDLEARAVAGEPVADGDRLNLLDDMVRAGGVLSTEPILPALFTIKGRPYSLRNHFVMAPLFMANQPRETTWKGGRQFGKSLNTAAGALVEAAATPHTTTLIVTPLFEQVRRFSANYVRPLIDESPLRPIWATAQTENSVFQKTFTNRAKMIFSFALMNADRTRGINTDRLKLDEYQDQDRRNEDVMVESMSASDWRTTSRTGTPKSLDNPLEVSYQDSSQAEWVIPCYSCTENGRPTLNVPAATHHLDRMIGEWYPDISEKRPGTICHKCGKPISPRHGRWWHRYPERRLHHAGYHVPQIIMPGHYADADKWAAVLAKRDRMSVNLFYNECLGESYDVGSKLVSQTEIREAAVLPWKNPRRDDDPVDDAILERLKTFRMVVLGVDWGGGRRVQGKPEISYTSMALVGLRYDGKVEVLWGCRLRTPHDHFREAYAVRRAIKRFRPHKVAHDFTGAGILRETILVQGGVPLSTLVPIQYVRASSQDLMRRVPPSDVLGREFFTIDKTRSLLMTVGMLRLGLMMTFQYDHQGDADPGLLHDFLALVDEESTAGAAGGVYIIRSQVGKSDDFAQAVNMACMTLWYACDAWPDYIKLTGSQTLGYDDLDDAAMQARVAELDAVFDAARDEAAARAIARTKAE